MSRDTYYIISMLRDILDNVEKGIIILDESENISYVNMIAKNKLNIKNKSINKLKIVSTVSNNNNKDTINLSINGDLYCIEARIIPVRHKIPNYEKIIIFDDMHNKEKCKSKTIGDASYWGIIKLDSIIGESVEMKKLKDRTKKISKSNSTVLITGESGTGKELIAKAIHTEGIRKNKPFIAINCAAIPETLLESELFGYVKGAFSGANNSGKIGKFELANGGTIFLDEIGDMPIHLQSKLLRLLQERKFARIGSNKLIDLDVRVIAATNKDLLKLSREGRFREDLYYRLNVIPINIPPLRNRKEDIDPLINNMIERKCKEFQIDIKTVDKELMDMMIEYDWPGNIRELENSIEYMINIAIDDEYISKDMAPLDIIRYFRENEVAVNFEGLNYKDKKCDSLDVDDVIPLKDLEKIYIKKLVDKYGNTTKGKKIVAKSLGIGLATLYRKLDEK